MTRSQTASLTAPAGAAEERDGRIMLFIILLTYFGALFAGSFIIPFEDLWNKLRVPALGPFCDLLFITRDGERLLHGLPKANGADYFFYPPACYWFAYLGLGERHNMVAGFVLTSAFFLSLFAVLGRVRREHVPLYAALFCSPSVMLGVSRGNIDLFVFILLVASIFLLQKSSLFRSVIAYGLILFSAMLKLYPIVSTIVALREKRSRWLLIGTVLALLFGVYLWFSLNDLREMNKSAPRLAYLTFGAAVIFERLDYGGPHNLTYGLSLSLLVAAIAMVWGLRKGGEFRRAVTDARLLDGFRIGSVIYLSCFALIQYNFIYRHVTLLLTVPQWLLWRASGGRTARLATVVLVSLVLAFWLPRHVRNFWNLDQLCDWVLFALYSFAFGATLPCGVPSPEPDSVPQPAPAV